MSYKYRIKKIVFSLLHTAAIGYELLENIK